MILKIYVICNGVTFMLFEQSVVSDMLDFIPTARRLKKNAVFIKYNLNGFKCASFFYGSLQVSSSFGHLKVFYFELESN